VEDADAEAAPLQSDREQTRDERLPDAALAGHHCDHVLDALLLGHAARDALRGKRWRRRRAYGQLAGVRERVELADQVVELHAPGAVTSRGLRDRFTLADRARRAAERVAGEDPRRVGPAVDDRGDGHVRSDLSSQGGLLPF